MHVCTLIVPRLTSLLTYSRSSRTLWATISLFPPSILISIYRLHVPCFADTCSTYNVFSYVNASACANVVGGSNCTLTCLFDAPGTGVATLACPLQGGNINAGGFSCPQRMISYTPHVDNTICPSQLLSHPMLTIPYAPVNFFFHTLCRRYYTPQSTSFTPYVHNTIPPVKFFHTPCTQYYTPPSTSFTPHVDNTIRPSQFFSHPM